MASFIKGMTDQFGSMNLYTPDYAFLTQVYGTKQSQYDKGFNAVKSVYNSVLNSNITNENNQKFRADAFKKLESSLRSTANMDLSNAGNVTKALSMLDPISTDQDLAYDMQVTAYHDKQKQIMDQHKNSTDPELRKLYSDYSALNIKFAEEDLRNAGRGDDSIRNVRPADFVPFEDINEYLNKAAKDQGLVIETSGPTGTGYILKQKNGEQAVQPFQQWADQQMGTRFDRQLGVMGKVQAETDIRTKMQTEGISREAAIQSVAGINTPTILEENAAEGGELQENLKTIQNQIAVYDKAYGDTGIPESQSHIKEKYDKLVEQERLHKNRIESLQSDNATIQRDGLEYVARNIHGIYTQRARAKTAGLWGATKAMTSFEQELKSDATWVAKQNNALKVKFHQDNMMLKTADLKLRRDALALKAKIAAAKGSGSSSTTGDKDGQFEYLTGVVTSTETRNAIDIMSSQLKINTKTMFNGVTRAGDGLMNLIVDEADYGSTVAVMNKVHSMANGGTPSFSEAEKKILVDYGDKIGYEFNPDNLVDQENASAMLEAISAGTYETASNILPTYKESGILPDYVKSVEPFKKTLASMKKVSEVKGKIDKSMANINQLILDPSGQLKEEFEGAVIVGRRIDNAPIYDLSGISDAAKRQVDVLVNEDFKKLQSPTGHSYHFGGIKPNEWAGLMNENIAVAYDEDGDRVDIKEVFGQLNALPASTLTKLFGESLDTSFDPVKETMSVNMKIDATSTEAKKLGLDKGGVYKVEIPYATLKANRASFQRFANYADVNTAGSDIEGEFSQFLKDPYTTIKSPEYADNLGYSYEVTGVTYTDPSGRDAYGLRVYTKYYDPYKKGDNKYITKTETIGVTDPTNPMAFAGFSEKLDQRIQNYLIALGNAKNSKSNENSIPLSNNAQ